MVSVKALLCIVWSSQLSLFVAWTPSTKQSKCTIELKSSSSYEEQYAVLYASFTEAQQIQPSNKKKGISLGGTADDSTEQSLSSDTPSETNSEFHKQDAFLDFISTTTHAQFRSSTMSSPHQGVEPQWYNEITTSLDFTSFGSSLTPKERINLSSDADNADNIQSTNGASSDRHSRINQPSFSEPQHSNRPNHAPAFGLSPPYLDSIVTSRQTVPPPLQLNKGYDDSSLKAMGTPLQPALSMSREQQHASDMTPSSSLQFDDYRHANTETLPRESELTAKQNAQKLLPTTSIQAPTTTIETITVQVQTVLPNDVTIYQAKRAWLEYCWKQGSGIMVPTFSAEKTLQQRPALDNANVEIPQTREFLVPYGLKQELVELESPEKGVTVVGYRTIRRGPFWQDVLDGSHMATVEFMADREEGKDYKYSTRVLPTRMVWKVQFQLEVGVLERDVTRDVMDSTRMDYSDFFNTRLCYVLSKATFWKAWTKFLLESATTNFMSYLQTPISIDHTEQMPLGGESPRGM
jgi:hypothetical protein